MPPTNESSDRPKPSRIVINLERARQIAHVPKRGSRGARILGILALVLIAVIAAAAVGGYFWWESYKKKPAYTLALLVDAVERGDMAEFDRLVDTDRIVESFVPQVTDKALGRYASTLTGPLRGQVEALVPTLVPSVKQKVREEIIANAKELGARGKDKPFILVALGIPYVVDIKEEGSMAKVAATLKDRAVQLTMQPNGDRWKIVSVTDETLAARIVDNIAKDLPAVGSEVEKEVRKRLKKELPGGLPNIPLLGDEKKP